MGSEMCIRDRSGTFFVLIIKGGNVRRIMIALAQISSIMIISVGSIGAIKSLILHASVG